MKMLLVPWETAFPNKQKANTIWIFLIPGSKNLLVTFIFHYRSFPKIFQSLFPLFVLWQYLKGWARWCCMAWHKHWVRDICHYEELMQEPPRWSSLGLLSLQRNQSQNPDSSSELYVNAQLQTHAWLLHKPSERNRAVKFSLSSTPQEETFWLVIYRVSMTRNRRVLSWLKERGRYKTDLFAA